MRAHTNHPIGRNIEMIKKTMQIKTLAPGEKLSLAGRGFQHFSEEDKEPDQAGNPEETNKDKDPDTDNKGSNEEKEKKDDQPLFTQKQMSTVAAREAKEARAKIMKELGIEDIEKGKEALKAYMQSIEDQKTEAQKLQDKASELEGTAKTLQQERDELQTQLAAFKAGVDPEKLEDVTFLANKYMSDEVSVDEAIGQVLEKYPQFKAVQAEENKDNEQKPNFSTGEHNSEVKLTEDEKWTSAFKFAQS